MTRVLSLYGLYPEQPGNNGLILDSNNALTDGILDVICNVTSTTLEGFNPTADTSTAGSSLYGVKRDYASLKYTTYSNPNFKKARSIFVLFDLATAGNYSALLSAQDTSSTNGYELRLGSTINDTNILLSRANSGFRQHKASTSNLVANGDKNVPLCVTFPLDINSAPTFYVKGTKYTGVYSGGTGTGNIVQASNNNLYVGKRADNSTYFTGGIYLAIVFDRELSETEALSLSENPYQVFKSPICYDFYVQATGADATATGSVDSVDLSAVSGTASSSSTASGTIDSVDLSAPAGTATTGSDATATGSVDSVDLSAVSGTASSSSTASGAIDSVDLSAPTGTASNASNATATGTIDNIDLTAPGGTAASSSIASGAIDGVDLAAPTGTASGSSHGSATGAIDNIDLSAPTGTASASTLTLTQDDLDAIAAAVWSHQSAANVITLLTETWGRLGLDINAPLITGTTEITFGAVVMAMTEATGSVTLARQ